MNIFILDNDLKLSAAYHTDRHIVKMTTEYAQILSTNLYVLNIDIYEKYSKQLFKPTHINHPCVKWNRESEENFKYLIDLGIAVANEYTRRYGKIHSSSLKIKLINDIFKRNNLKFENKKLTKFPLCMPDKYKKDSVVESYRSYYLNEKRHIANWKDMEIPYWWN